MKMAFASEDGQTISGHFGHSPCFIVVTVEDGKVTGKETRQIPGAAPARRAGNTFATASRAGMASA